MKRRIMKEGSSGDKELIKTALDAAIKAKQLLDDAASTIRDAVGETFLFARLESHSMDLDDTIDDIKGVLSGELDATVDATDGFENPFLESRKRFGSKFVKESVEETEWFYSSGEMKKYFPMDCILDCSAPGQQDENVEYWVNKLNFHAPEEKGMIYLREYGLDDIQPEDVDKYVLWTMCGNIKEEAYEFCRDGSEWEYVDKDAYPEDIDDWGEEDWQRFQQEVFVAFLGM